MSEWIEYAGDMPPVPDHYIVEVKRSTHVFGGKFDRAEAGVIRWHNVIAYRVIESVTESANDIQVAGDHYRKLKIQAWDFIAANNIGFFEGNAIKYLTRWQDKGGVEDLRKAKHYIEKLIEIHTKEAA